MNKSETIKIKTSCGNIYLTGVFNEGGRLIEVIPRLGKAGTCAGTMFHLYGLLFSSILKLKRNQVIKILTPLTGHTPLCGGCINNIISYILDYMYEKEEFNEEEDETNAY